jgi:hypothetical protein
VLDAGLSGDLEYADAPIDLGFLTNGEAICVDEG